MIISQVTTTNFLGTASQTIDIDKPLAMFCGPNGSGKSTVREAIRFALTETPERAKFVKDYKTLVTEGQKKGGVAIVHDDGDIAVVLPSGKISANGGIPTNKAIPVILDPRVFVDMKADDRRTLLYDIMKARPNGAKLVENLKARGCDLDKGNQAGLMLKTGGFKAAEDLCAEEAKAAKQTYRAVTGENWGAEKAADWQPARPKFDAKAFDGLKTERAEQNERVSAASTEWATARERRRAALASQVDRDSRAAQIKVLPQRRDKLVRDLAELEKWTAQVEELTAKAGDGPRVGLVHELAKALHDLLEHELVDDISCLEADFARGIRNKYEAQFGKIGAEGDPEAKAQLVDAEKAKTLYTNAVAACRRDIAAGEAAEKVKDTEVAAPTDDEFEAIEKAMTDARKKLEALDAELSDQALAKSANDNADENKRKADEAHKTVVEWLALKDAFSPTGIPADILSSALDPFNAFMAEQCTIANWRSVALTTDLDIVADDRPYVLHSVGEQFRIATIIAIAVAKFSGVGMVAIDGFDVLDVPGRGDLFYLCEDLIDNGHLQQILLFGTTKTEPDNMGDGYNVFWFGGGSDDK